MKIIMSLFVLLSGIFLQLQAVNLKGYQTIYSNTISFFENEILNGMKIDSVHIEKNDSIFYPVKNLQQIDIDAFEPAGASFLGDKIIIRDNWNFFFNENNDTIKIKTDAELNESWIAFNIDSLSVQAKVINHDIKQFLGLEDSVKTISFQVFDKNNLPINSDLNQKTIELSKQYGFIKTLNFVVFPEEKKYDYSGRMFWDLGYYDTLNEFFLAGLSKPKVGKQNLTWFDIHDFEVDDEIHTDYLEHYGGYRGEQKRTILRYLSKQLFADKIIYSVERKEIYTELKFNPPYRNETITFDTITSTININSDFDKIIGEISFSSIYGLNIVGGDENKKLLYKPRIIYIDNVWCHDRILADGLSVSPDVYMRGLGGPYYDSEDNLGFNRMYRKLVYYKKGDVVWGEPLAITGIDNVEGDNGIIIYPNPVKDLLWVSTDKLSNPCMFTILDLKGSILQQSIIDKENNVVDLNSIPEGLYIYQLSKDNKLIHTGKIMKSLK